MKTNATYAKVISRTGIRYEKISPMLELQNACREIGIFKNIKDVSVFELFRVI